MPFRYVTAYSYPPHFSRTLCSYPPKALPSKPLTLLERADKKQQTVKTLILSSFDQIRVLAVQKIFVRNAGYRDSATPNKRLRPGWEEDYVLKVLLA